MLRLALISTPRSGNTWARGLLARLYGLEQIPVHFPDDIPWDDLPERCLIQIHWYPIEPFYSRLREHGVRVVVMARHPLDVLMSWLNYSYYVHLEGHCLGQGVCTECGIVGALPGGEAFRNYVLSESCRILLCYSPAWWKKPGILRLRYEDLVADPEAALERLAAEIGEAPRRAIAGVVEETSIRRMKPSQQGWQYHYWQGQPGLWRETLTAETARAIAAFIPEPFEFLGYPCDPNEALDPGQAERNWLRLQLESTREHLSLERARRLKAVQELAASRESMRPLMAG
jgi:hypothetical protein